MSNGDFNEAHMEKCALYWIYRLISAFSEFFHKSLERYYLIICHASISHFEHIKIVPASWLCTI